jgi:hypothetical protein
MKDKPKILTYSFLGLIATVILTQYEIREYLRFIPSNYWPLKFVLQYWTGAVVVLIAVIGGVRLLVKHKTLFSSTPLIILITGLICVWIIKQLTTNIDYDNIVIKNGLYIDSTIGKPLDGMYKSPSLWDGFGKDEHCCKIHYEKGIPTGKWMYSFKGELIHSGVYLDERDLNHELISLSKSKRVDINLWEEGEGYPMLTIDLINPISQDSNTIETISKLTIQSLNNKYKFKILYIENVTEKERITLKETSIK